ncbi:hypothetical protein [uncultured Psychroserpens sp.]|uniref:hypothetical protein n=1 Tax=uncultured Psychroserpens sp. TaxID=255436 RepID=UPI00263757E2|nr:hypothetical protein [uncultured Psychroserpens sp.]
MTVFESLNNTTDKAGDIAQKYVETSRDYVKLKVFQQLSLSISLAIKLIVIGGLIGIALIFLAVSAAIAIGNELGNLALGYVCIGSLFIVLALLAYSLRKHLDRTIVKRLSNNFFD